MLVWLDWCLIAYTPELIASCVGSWCYNREISKVLYMFLCRLASLLHYKAGRVHSRMNIWKFIKGWFFWWLLVPMFLMDCLTLFKFSIVLNAMDWAFCIMPKPVDFSDYEKHFELRVRYMNDEDFRKQIKKINGKRGINDFKAMDNLPKNEI